MSKIAISIPEEPEKPKSWEEQVSEYRNNYRSALKQIATVLTLPLRKTSAVLKVAAAKK